jgi:hypothetical protein
LFILILALDKLGVVRQNKDVFTMPTTVISRYCWKTNDGKHQGVGIWQSGVDRMAKLEAVAKKDNENPHLHCWVEVDLLLFDE